MKKIQSVLIFGFVFSSLFSCGGYEKSSKLVISTLNYDSNFSLKVPVYQAQLGNGVSFYYQDGHSKESLYSSLDKEGYSYEECGKYLFFSAIVNKKVEHFVVEENENDAGQQMRYLISSSGADYKTYEGNYTRWRILLPYFMLEDKTEYFDMVKFCHEKQKSITFDTIADYPIAKMIYQQSSQKEAVYDDEKKSITLYGVLRYQFTDSQMVMERIYTE
ncbi:MAG: hypothetical protein SOX76_00570 [Candidatus Enterosoma sp.]|nr:hypothetical protein [Candidatus Enterosoma sp.]